MNDLIRKYYVNEELAEPYIFKENGKEFKVYPFVLSTETLDRQFEKVRLKPDAIKNFKANPKMFLNHDSRQLPLGEWKNIRIEDGKLKADAYFHNLDENSSLIESYVATGQLKAASIGFQSLKRNTVDPDEKDLQIIKDNTWSGKVLIHEKIDILEASIVSIPANPEALAGKALLTDEQTKSIDELFENSTNSKMETIEEEDEDENLELEFGYKAGAVLNKANKDKLNKAKSLIDEVISSAGDETSDNQLQMQLESLQAEVNDLKHLVELQGKQLADNFKPDDEPVETVTISNPQVKLSLTEYLKNFKKDK